MINQAMCHEGGIAEGIVAGSERKGTKVGNKMDAVEEAYTETSGRQCIGAIKSRQDLNGTNRYA